MKGTAYLFQAALICVWWVGLASNRFFFAAFQFDEIPPTAFWAFFAPDVLLIAALSTVPILIYSVLGALVWHLVVRPSEERDMSQRFGEPHEVYRRQVSCWMPTFR
ncbi:MAG: hypothetical protein NTY15_00160 [Planctomycetota bacterium]|nr:hypothetical protein [Planctomycetota bacterium]